MTSGLDVVHRGRAWTLGDSVDTNQLAGGGFLGADPSQTLRLNCLRALRPEFPDQVRPGDIVVAGRNFGCGSSRQTAVEALMLSGVGAVVVESVARIFRRNSIALAFPVYLVPGVSGAVVDGDEIVVDYPRRRLLVPARGAELAVCGVSAGVERVYAGGGLAGVIAQRLTAEGFPPSAESPTRARRTAAP